MKLSTLPTSAALALALGMGAAGLAADDRLVHDGEFIVDGMIFGLPEAEVFQDNYDGPPVVGDYLTALPHLAELDYQGNRTHEVRLDTFAQKIEVAPGRSYTAWTYGGSAPGPTLHVREGDRVVFTMKNRSDEPVLVTEPLPGASPYFAQLQTNPYQNHQPAISPMPHSMDLHSGTVAADDKWRTIPPGMTIRFEWVANYPGVYMYHCGTPSVLMHTSMGQYGAVVVSPREGFDTDDRVDHEYVVVQSEFYLTKDDTTGDYRYDHQAAMDRKPSHVTFNGHVNALHDEPLRANAGDRVRLYVLNAGPSGTSSFHVIGAIFDRVWFEGSGGPGLLPTRGSHRSGRAGFPHPAPRITASLLDGKRCAPRAGVVRGNGQAPSGTGPSSSGIDSSAGSATSASTVRLDAGSGPGPVHCQ